MITLVTSEYSSGFEYFINKLFPTKFQELNLSDKYLFFPESGKTEVEIFNWLKTDIIHKDVNNMHLCILTNSSLIRDLLRLALHRNLLNCDNFQNLFIDHKNYELVIKFDQNGRTETWPDQNLELQRKIYEDLLSDPESGFQLNWNIS